MNDLRTLIQEALDEIEDVDCGIPLPDDLIEDDETYFGYELNNDYIESDFDKHDSRQLSIIGHVVRKQNMSENTLQIVDEALEEIVDALKGLNFHLSYEDVSLDKTIRKTRLTGYVRYNEINNWIV